MTEPTEADRERAELWCYSHPFSAPTLVAQLIADVRAEERGRGEAERLMLNETIDRVSAISHASYAERDAAKARAEAAEAKLAELVREMWLWFNSGVSSELGPVHIDNFEDTLRRNEARS